MKQAQKVIIVLAILGAMGSIYYLSYKSARTYYDIVHFKHVMQELDQTKNHGIFELRKERLQKYYNSGEYEQDVYKVCKKAESYLCKLPVKNSSLIIFDIDDTAVYHYQYIDRLDFIWKQQPRLIQARERGMSPAIKPVLEFYKKLLAKGFKIIFLSSRNSGDYEHTLNELKKAGYTEFEKIILMPDKLAFDPTIKPAHWKMQMRQQLEQQYDIVATVGDQEADFEGGYTGYIVKLPNYLY
jgi:predicted secreted acid phosphatase